MFGFSELLLIAVVALVVIGPRDLPVALRHMVKFFREMRALYAGLKQQVSALVDEPAIADIRSDLTTIIDLEGKPQQAYNVADLDAITSTKTQRSYE